eukprot:1975118-Amphidinium_carterae.1
MTGLCMAIPTSRKGVTRYQLTQLKKFEMENGCSLKAKCIHCSHVLFLSCQHIRSGEANFVKLWLTICTMFCTDSVYMPSTIARTATWTMLQCIGSRLQCHNERVLDTAEMTMVQ